MRKLKIGILDLVANRSKRTLWSRTMNPNFASIMPQVIATWCEAEGHAVTFGYYLGGEDIVEALPDDKAHETGQTLYQVKHGLISEDLCQHLESPALKINAA